MNLLWFSEKYGVVTPKLPHISALTGLLFSFCEDKMEYCVCVLLPGA